MNNKILFILIFLLAIGFQSVFAQDASLEDDADSVDTVSVVGIDEEADVEGELEAEDELAQDQDTEGEEEEPTVVADADADSNIPLVIRNNQYYLESLRLADLAKSSYEEGEYDASSDYAEQAIRQAELSDEYVALQLKRRAANKAITAAKQRLDWASTSGAAKQHPDEYSEARGYYDTSLTARSAGKWEDAYDSAIKVLEILALFDAPAGALPAQYTVRPWASTKDCLWNIAGQPWAYNDPFKWKLIYDANKSKMPEPENPDLIEPSMVLTIPALKGEARQGMYDPAKNYGTIK